MKFLNVLERVFSHEDVYVVDVCHGLPRINERSLVAYQKPTASASERP